MDNNVLKAVEAMLKDKSFLRAWCGKEEDKPSIEGLRKKSSDLLSKVEKDYDMPIELMTDGDKANIQKDLEIKSKNKETLYED
jgi:hypothetical protein